MNSIQKGYSRDNKILKDTEDFKALHIRQIQALHFSDIKTWERKSQETMLRLNNDKKLNRWMSFDGKIRAGYCYSLDKKPKQLEHLIMLNWVRIWFQKRLRSTEQMYYFKYEDTYKKNKKALLRTDGFMIIRNVIAREVTDGSTREFNPWFIEMDIASSGNDFDKVPKYTELYNLMYAGGLDRWWLKICKSFPWIMVVTTDPKRKAEILQRIADENTYNIRFEVKLIDEIIAEVCRSLP